MLHVAVYYMYAHVCVCVQMHSCIFYVYVCMYACMHACMHACMYVCMYILGPSRSYDTMTLGSIAMAMCLYVYLNNYMHTP